MQNTTLSPLYHTVVVVVVFFFFQASKMWSSLIMPIRQEQMVFYSTVNYLTFTEENPGRFISNMKVPAQRKNFKIIMRGRVGAGF